MLGNAQGPVREALVHHSISGRFAIREGKWKLCLSPGSGGWSAPRDPQAAKQGLPAEQLYDMTLDLAETMNLVAEKPEIVARMTERLERIVAGQSQENAVPVIIRKPIDGTEKQ